MNYKMTSYILGHIAVLEAVLLCIPFVLSIIYGEDTLLGFGIAILALVLIGVPFSLKKPEKRDFRAREGFVIVALSWILLSLFGSLPFFISGYIPNFIDSLFETISGFTTTGGTILSDIQSLPKSLLFWRSLTQWVGGMGVLVFIIAIIPKSDAKIIHLFRAESPGPQVGELVSKLKFTARILYGIYIGLTLSQVIFLLFGGMSLFDSFVHALGTAGTGGFSSMNGSISAYNNAYIDIVITVYMFLFAISFNIYYLILIGSIKQALKSEELRTFVGIIFISSLIITISLAVNRVYSTLGETIRHSIFHTVSMASTTAYTTADYNSWPLLAQTVLFLLMFIGACAGSTGGGLKVSRAIILIKTGLNEIRKTVSPRSVLNIKFDGKTLDPAVSNGVLAYFSIYMFIFAISVLLISISSIGGLNFITNISAVNSSINNIGSGFGNIGHTGNYAFYNAFCKMVLAFDMLVGRLEILPMLLIFNPRVWKKKF